MARKTKRIKIVSDEILEKVNDDNLKLTKRFLREKSTRLSPASIKNYSSDLNIFWTWNYLENDNAHFAEIRKLEFAEFFSYCVDELGWGSARFARMKSTLSSFSNFIEKFYDEDFPKFRNVILRVIENLPHSNAREKTVLTKEQVDGLFENLKDSPQDACLLGLAVSSGARVSELLRFTTDIIDENNYAFGNNIFIETLKPIKTKGRGGGKMLYKYIVSELFFPYYNTWLPIRQEIMDKNGQDHNYLFIKKNGQPATIGTLRSWFVRWEKYLGVDFYPHCLRHFLVTHLISLGLSQDLIIEIFGWSSAEMVQVYNDLKASDRKWDELENLKGKL